MIFIRERLASHDLKVAQYYARRNIHIATANRAKNLIAEYPDTQAARSALDILEISYMGMGMTDADLLDISAVLMSEDEPLDD